MKKSICIQPQLRDYIPAAAGAAGAAGAAVAGAAVAGAAGTKIIYRTKKN